MKDLEILNLEQLVYVKGGGPKGEPGYCSECHLDENHSCLCWAGPVV